MVRAGRGGFLAQDFEDRGVVSVGFGELGDLTKIKNSSELVALYQKLNPDQKAGKVRSSAERLARFRFELQKYDCKGRA